MDPVAAVNPPAVGFVGLGVMGQAMALNLRRAGWPLTVHARNPERTRPLAEQGATLAVSPHGVATACEVIFINVSDDAAAESVLFGADGLVGGLAPGDIVIDMGTTSPTATRRFARRLETLGAILLDAPVSGGEAGAKAGTLSIMVGGPEAAFEKVLPLLQSLGSNILRIGDSGAGQVAKACNQIVASATLLGVAEAIHFARRQGVEAGKVRGALLGGFAYSRILEVHGRRMLDGDFVPGFRARLHQKDLGMVLSEAQKIDIGLPATALAAEIVTALVDSGDGDLDSAALLKMVERLDNSC
jgi:2-hydroxy-3-oxopropionate reductase